MPGRLGVVVIVVAVLVGTVITVLAGSDPGLILGGFLIAGTVLGALVVRPGGGYLLFPVPAVAYVVAAVTAGLIHDRTVDASYTGLALSAVQWIASGFIAMSVATALAIAIAALRWARSGRAQEPHLTTTDRAGPAG